MSYAEAHLDTSVVAKCQNDPEYAIAIAKSSKREVLKNSYGKLLSESLSIHPSTRLIVSVAKSSSLKDLALDNGTKVTHTMQH